MFLKKYWVNNVDIKGVDVKYGQCVIGLYRGGWWKGGGNFGGWYSYEYMCNTTLLGYFVIESSLVIEKGREHIKEVILKKPKWCRKLEINSLYTQGKILARNNKEALELFFAEQWDESQDFW